MQEPDPPRTLAFHPNTRSVVYFGPFRLDLSDGLLTQEGADVRLPPRALAILQHLVERSGRIVSKQSLMDVAWKDAHVSETSLTEAIGLIRQALGDDPQKPTFIQTVHRRGYRFVATIATEPPPPSSLQPEVLRPRTPIDAAQESVPATMASGARSRWMIVSSIGTVAVLVAFTGVWSWTARRPSQPGQAIRVNVAFPLDQAPIPSLNAHPIVALSPDGQRLVYVGGGSAKTRLFLREMNRFDAVPLPGTEGAHGPFFSPDGAWVAFFADGQLKKVRTSASERAAPQVLCATEPGVGGAWVSADEIVFVPNWRGPLMRVPASGGQPLAVTRPGVTYRWPDRLDNETILATRWRSSTDDAAVVAVSLASGAERVVAEPATFGRYAPDGHVLFVRDGDLYAVSIDASAARAMATPTRLIPAVMTGTTGAAQFTMSPSGSLLYIDDIPERGQRTLARLDSRGVATDLPVPAHDFRYVSACGNRLAATLFARGQTELWWGSLDRAAMTQITREGAASEPVWSPDCRTIAFSWNRTGVATIYMVAVESGDAARVLFESPLSSAPGSWSADGRWLAYTEQHPATSADIWLWDRSTGHRRPIIATAGPDLLPALSPDGNYVAYESRATGAFEIEVANVQTGARTQVSVAGGTWPSWSADGRELFFLGGTTIKRVAVQRQNAHLVVSDAASFFTNPDIVSFRGNADQFVWLRRTAGIVPVTRSNLVLNWTSELSRSVR
ncbi:MAG TPA: winged helix-turn-helix domain-containing protein [Vicinamibacterales bacterium]|nr:winged helix-turn-helix domain-containing protein [Vicinamibacterales bacterium]